MNSPANGSVRVAQVGCGYWGKNLVRNFSEIGALEAVSDLDPETTERFASQYSVRGMTFADVMSEPTIDAVAFATPAPLHASQARLAMENGKHVFLEKPLALTTEDALELKSVIAETGRTLMVGHLLQYHPIFAHLRTMVQNGDLGDVEYVYSNRLSLGKVRIEENVLWSFAPHDLSMILSLVGEKPNKVRAQGHSMQTDGIEDYVLVTLGFENGAKGHVQVSWNHPFKEQRLTVIGSKAMAVFEDSLTEWGSKLAIYRHTFERTNGVPVPSKADAEYPEIPIGEPLKNQCQHFVDSIANGTRPRTDVDEGLAVLQVLEQAEFDLAKARGSIDPETPYQFPGQTA
ncbi:MAG: Gfo/Idh/MocA family oxidoreductase [Pseudomonadota bacterium]